jgi:hypothetical protein
VSGLTWAVCVLSDGLGADYCLLHTVSGLSSEMNTVAERIRWSYELRTKCYPPYVTCVNGTEESCQPLAQQQATAGEGRSHAHRGGHARSPSPGGCEARTRT